MSEPLLDVRDLRVAFDTPRGRVRAVDGVSFTVAATESVGVLGESGSGKSVTGLALLRLFSPLARARVSGEIRFAGRDLLALREREMGQVRGAEIGMVFQDPLTSLDPVVPVGRQITEAMRHHRGTGKPAAARRAVELLDLVGIPDAHRRADDLPHRFSGGMRQRIVIAMAVACEPKLLIADEPTTALDVTVQAQILRLLNTLRRELGMALILISHDLGVIAASCDTVQVMYAGRIAERGTIRHLLDSAHHPYSQGLIRLVPRLDRERHSRLRAIDGAPPSVIGQWQGCRFAPRCPQVMERCHDHEPPAFALGPVHTSACWLDESQAQTRKACG